MSEVPIIRSTLAVATPTTPNRRGKSATATTSMR
jgi:hypothetical protein